MSSGTAPSGPQGESGALSPDADRCTGTIVVTNKMGSIYEAECGTCGKLYADEMTSVSSAATWSGTPCSEPMVAVRLPRVIVQELSEEAVLLSGPAEEHTRRALAAALDRLDRS